MFERGVRKPAAKKRRWRRMEVNIPTKHSTRRRPATHDSRLREDLRANAWI